MVAFTEEHQAFRKTVRTFVEREIENYKESVPRSVLLSIGDDAVRALAGAALLMVVEVARGRVEAPADVDAQRGRVLSRAVAGADDLQRPVDERQHGDREDVVGVEVAGVGGDLHQAFATNASC